MKEQYIVCNKKYQIEKVIDNEGFYYNVYNKKDMQVETSFAYLNSARKYIDIELNNA